ncbi:glycosyltransferase [Clostridium cavendishii]|nr:glycosyltransferase [Clostridium cavendishii]
MISVVMPTYNRVHTIQRAIDKNEYLCFDQSISD